MAELGRWQGGTAGFKLPNGRISRQAYATITVNGPTVNGPELPYWTVPTWARWVEARLLIAAGGLSQAVIVAVQPPDRLVNNFSGTFATNGAPPIAYAQIGQAIANQNRAVLLPLEGSGGFGWGVLGIGTVNVGFTVYEDHPDALNVAAGLELAGLDLRRLAELAGRPEPC